MGIMFREAYEREQAAVQSLDERLAKRKLTVCPVDALAYRNGHCPACGRRAPDPEPAPPKADGTPPSQEALQRQFYTRLAATNPEAWARHLQKYPKDRALVRPAQPDEPSLVQQAKRFINPDGSLIEM